MFNRIIGWLTEGVKDGIIEGATDDLFDGDPMEFVKNKLKNMEEKATE